MFGDFILDFEEKRIEGSRPRRVITPENTSFHDLGTAIDEPAYGFLSYDCGRFIEKLPGKNKNDLGLPDFCFFLPGKLSIRDKPKHQNVRTDERKNDSVKSNFSKADFEQIIFKAKEYIAAGDIYQVNLSQRLEVPFSGNPLELYERLNQINPSPFASYFDFGDWQVISCSPERLIKLQNGIAETRPIAGTRPIWAKEEDLILNEKERAEHIMLVDLERNDLGRVCDYETVKVTENMVIERYSHVMHIVSNIRGHLRSDKNWCDLVKAMFPGGTITGCPKVRSMEIIEELEPVKRGLYTGSVGWIDPATNSLDLNIVIRTIIIKNGQAYIQVGAGIVADSDPEKEYEETLHKAEAMLMALKA